MSTYGTRTTDTIGRAVRVSADGCPRRKAGGLSIDWDTVAAVAEETALADGTLVKAGDKYLRYGQIVTRITASGRFGPADTAAADGREIVTGAVRGDAFIVDETVLRSQSASDHPAVLDGGLVFKGRILMGGAGQPTEAQVEAMFPGITFVTD